jgi:hypothetical protein
MITDCIVSQLGVNVPCCFIQVCNPIDVNYFHHAIAFALYIQLSRNCLYLQFKKELLMYSIKKELLDTS